MTPRVRTLPTTEAGERAELHGSVLVIDILRATTTLVQAFESGAAEALPAGDIPSALRLADELAHAGVLLCGERWGQRIPGFDLGNSPLEYTPERVCARPLVFASSNGSRALKALPLSARAGVAALVNAAAAARWAAAGEGELTLLCAGEDGQESQEDLLGAGAVVWALGAGRGPVEMDALSARALQMYQSARTDLALALRTAPHGMALARVGFGPDLEAAARENTSDRVPEWHQGRLRPGRPWPG